TLILDQHDTLPRSAHERLTLAADLTPATDSAAALYVGAHGHAATDAAARHGIHHIYTLDPGEDAIHPVLPALNALTDLVRTTSPRLVLLPSSHTGRNIAGRLAVRLNAGLITDAIAVAADPAAPNGYVVTQSAFAGTHVVEAVSTTPTLIVCLSPGALTPSTNPVTPHHYTLATTPPSGRTARIITRTPRNPSTFVDGVPTDIAEADIVIAGGRGTNGNFEPIRALAQRLDAAVAASRAAVDAGWIDHTAQVGQTGQSVSPRLYIACGISGAVQHVAGMRTATTVVVINSDPDALIFHEADLGIIGDLFTVIPQALQHLDQPAPEHTPTSEEN
ncbi:electron transfer flavoprotein subunit alpha/FixB family protein, partial [Dermatophilus congolensis]